MGKNLTDNEIKKALECCITDNKKSTCKQCPYGEVLGRCYDQLNLDALDLINRLQSENEKWQGGYMTQKEEIANLEIELKAMRGAANSYKAENEELNKENDRLSQVVLYNDGITKMKVEEAKAEAYTEFAERLKEKLDPTLIAITKIGCVLVEVSKSHISSDSAIEKIREYLKDLEIETRLSFDMFVCDLLKEMVGDSND